jgi:hypothetical protein
MSQENIDMVIYGFRLFEAGEIDVEGRWHDDCLVTAPEEWPEKGPFRGKEAIRRQLERLREDYVENRVSEIEVLAAEGEWVVLRFTWETRGTGSEIESTTTMAAAFRVKDKLLSETHYRFDPKEAVEAAGL